MTATPTHPEAGPSNNPGTTPRPSDAYQPDGHEPHADRPDPHASAGSLPDPARPDPAQPDPRQPGERQSDPHQPDGDLLAEVDALVEQWVRLSADLPVSAAARLLAGVLADPHGLEFTVGMVDGVVRPADVGVAAANLREVVRLTPAFLPWYLKAGTRLGAAVSTVAPGLVVPVVRRVLRGLVGHLLVDATDARLGKAIARIRARGMGLNLNLLGEAVLGAGEAGRRLSGTQALLARDDVDYVSIKVSATVPPHSPWGFDEAVADVCDRLLPLFLRAVDGPTPTFVNLDMEEYHDLDLTIAVFTRLLDRPELLGLEAGIVLQAYLPDALAAMIRLQDWAAARRARGGAGIKVRLVKGANLPMERVDAELHGWPPATWGSKQATDTGYKRVLDWAMTPERTANVRLGVAGHNLFDIAHAWTLAGRRGVRGAVEIEMLLGMAEAQAEAVRRTVGRVLLYVPVVHPREFDVAIAYLVRRLEEGVSQENFMSAVLGLADDPALKARERARFVAALGDVDAAVPAPNRTQDRRTEAPTEQREFANTPDTDPSLPGNRDWARAVVARVAGSTLARDLVDAHTVTSADALDDVLARAHRAGAAWGGRPVAERAAVLRRAAVELARRRGDLVEVMAAECGKTVDQADPEVSEAIDFANWYAACALDLARVDGAVPVPVPLTVVTPPWNFPVAIPAGSTLAALAAGSAVVVKPATQARRCGSLMVQALWDAGVPREVLHLVHTDEGELGRRLVADPRVGRLILTGAFDTAALFRSFRPDLPLLAETSGKNAIVVTPSADLDLAVKDLVASAFGHAGQKCSAASLGVLVGSVATSRRFHDQLLDAVTSLRVGYPDDPSAQLGPLIEAPTGKLLAGLTQLGAGERWAVRPRPLDDSGRLWSPGVRSGVRPGSAFHLTEYFGPVLGLVAVPTLDAAIEVVNQVDYGLTSGLHSLDAEEIATWLDRVQAGNLYVNRGVTGAIVRRQPFGGWKRSAVGPGAKAGGPSYLIGLTDWAPAQASAAGADTPLTAVAVAAGLPDADVASLRRAFATDASVWRELGTPRDVSGLTAERDVLRHLPVPVWVRFASGEVRDLLRVVGAGLRVGASVRVSVSAPTAVDDALRGLGVTVLVEDDAAWSRALAGLPEGRVRLIGGDRESFARASGGRAELALYAGPVVDAGRVELLTFLHEQAIAMTAHRFGTPTSLVRVLGR